jgi:hypothetical protein
MLFAQRLTMASIEVLTLQTKVTDSEAPQELKPIKYNDGQR